jgi:hypothetical protein
MAISPLNVGEDKLTKAVNLSRARAGQVHKCDRSRVRWDGRMELIPD